MKKKILIGSIIAVALLTLVSFSSAVGYGSVDKNPVPDLDCCGDLDWTDVEPGETVIGSFTVENIGEEGSLLDWEIESFPDWGTWTFDPDSGLDLTPEAGAVTVTVDVVAPEDPEVEFEGDVVLVNSEDPDDICVIAVALPIYKQKLIDDATPIEFKLQRIKELVQSIDLRKIIVNPDAVIETLEEISTILEEEDVRNYIEKSSDEGCGCEDDNPELVWLFQYICYLLFPIYVVLVVVSFFTFIPLGYLLEDVARSLGCVWAYLY